MVYPTIRLAVSIAERLIKSHARFHFAIGKRNVFHFELKMADAFFLNEKGFLFQAQHAAEAHAAIEPNFDLMADRQIHLAGQDFDCHAAAKEPTAIAVFGGLGIEMEFALAAHTGENTGGAEGLKTANGRNKPGEQWTQERRVRGPQN